MGTRPTFQSAQNLCSFSPTIKSTVYARLVNSDDPDEMLLRGDFSWSSLSDKKTK